jgi:phosphoglycolate phosphatase-like HAD superfamily hydrolase
MLVFDFDGTLVDSVPIKLQAFDRCFEKFTAERERIRAYCQGNNHTPRWEKFKHVYERILRLPYTPEIEQELHHCFERETTGPISRAPALPGIPKFLDWVRPKYRTALLSSTPHKILLQILGKRGWTHRFDEVQGAPVNKAAWLKGLESRGFPGPQVIFFGDTPEDAQAAREAGCEFISVPEMQDFRKLL